MVMPREKVLALVREVRDGLVGLYGDRLKGVYLFGSHARGDAREGSDIDVAVVLRGPVDDWEEGERASDLLGDLSLRDDCVITALFISEEDFRNTPYAIHRSIVLEGVPV